MKLTFIGAANEVTGSCFFLEACGKNILIDCGMEQGKLESGLPLLSNATRVEPIKIW